MQALPENEAVLRQFAEVVDCQGQVSASKEACAIASECQAAEPFLLEEESPSKEIRCFIFWLGDYRAEHMLGAQLPPPSRCL